MKAIDRPLRRLQERLAPQENEVVRLVALLRARRRRRAEACGEPFEVRPCERLTGGILQTVAGKIIFTPERKLEPQSRRKTTGRSRLLLRYHRQHDIRRMST